MAKYKLIIVDEDKVLINTIPAQPADGFDEGTKVVINVKFGPHGNLFGSINDGSPVTIIPKAVFEVTMDSAKTVTLYKEGDEPVPPAPEAQTPTIRTNLPSTAEIPADAESTTLTIVASVTDGGTLSYAWTKDGTEVSGATSATLTVTEAGTYQCTVTNTLGGDTATAQSTACVVTKAE